MPKFLRIFKNSKLLLPLFVVGFAVIGTLALHNSKAVVSTTATPLVGAIRWDAWYTGGPGQYDEVALSPSQWHDRIPFYSTVLSDGSVQIRLDNQSDMDKEINYAKAGGLDYWAFDYYGDSSGMSGALHKYMASPYKSNMRFSLLLLTQAFQASDWPASAVNYMKDPQYVKVLNGRPLVYIYMGSDAITASAITQFRNAAAAAGLPNPYIVWMTWNVNDGQTANLGLDAVSAYAQSPTGSPDTVVPYSNLSSVNQQSWNDAKSMGLQSVPLVSTGWDPRPRWVNPPPWDTGGPHTAVTTGSPSEITSNLQSAHDWMKVNPYSVPSNAIIMYAWNEFAEGGWLDPLLSTGSARLDAIKPLVDSWQTGDITPPSITVNSPLPQSVVQGITTISSSATDDTAVAGVQYMLDGLRLGQEITSAPYNLSWNSRTVTNGTHILSAMVRDSSGNTSTSPDISLVVNNSNLSLPAGGWKFDESSGTTASDSSGNNNSGTLIGGSAWVAGNTAGAVSFNGTDGYVNVPDSPNLDNTEALTVSTWIKLDQYPTQNYVVLGKDSGGTSYRITIGSSGAVSFTVHTTNNGWYTTGTNINALSTIKLGTWTQIVGTYDGTFLRIYFNGQLQRTSIQTISGNIYDSTSPLRFGYKSASNIDFTKGSIDQSYVFPVALNSSEVRSLYQAPSAPVVAITQPADSQTVWGIVNVNVNASDPSGIAKVEFYIDGQLKNVDSLAPYVYQLDTTGYVHNSLHNISTEAYDLTFDNSISSITIKVMDVTPPTVSITSPLNNSKVLKRSLVQIQSSASDISGILKVEFRVNNSLLCSDTTAPYSCSWSVPAAKNIKYTLQTKAFDIAGNSATASVAVTSY